MDATGKFRLLLPGVTYVCRNNLLEGKMGTASTMEKGRGKANSSLEVSQIKIKIPEEEERISTTSLWNTYLRCSTSLLWRRKGARETSP